MYVGNPGVVDYYREFMKELHHLLVKKFPEISISVWGVSHAGHQRDNLDRSVFPCFEGNLHTYIKTCTYKAFILFHILQEMKICII